MEALTLLKAGKKIKVDRNFVYPPTPMMQVGYGGTQEIIDLTEVPLRKPGDYSPDHNVTLDTLKIVGYSDGICKRIEYVYANPQMNRLFAHLEDGTEEDYKLSIIDLWGSYKGEYIEPVKVILRFYGYVDGVGTQCYSKELKVSTDWSNNQLVDFVLHNERDHLDKDILITLPSGYIIVLKSNTRQSVLTEDHLKTQEE